MRSSLPRRLDGLLAQWTAGFAQSLWVQNSVSPDAVRAGWLRRKFYEKEARVGPTTAGISAAEPTRIIERSGADRSLQT